MEVQDRSPDYPLPVKRVGFRGVVKRVTIRSPLGPFQLAASLDLFVEISVERKGAHLSRNVDAINLLQAIPEESWSLEGYVDAIHGELLDLHPYSSSATVSLRTTYWAPLRAYGIEGVEPVKVRLTVTGTRDSKTYSTSVTVKGMTVCPSAQASISEILKQEGPSPSHVQKVLLTGTVRVPRLVVIRVEDIASCLWSSLSAPAFTLLKKQQEARLVLGAFQNPKFAEDVVREATARVWCRFGQLLPEGSTIKAEVLSLESIHPQNVYAMTYGTARELAHLKCETITC